MFCDGSENLKILKIFEFQHIHIFAHMFAYFQHIICVHLTYDFCFFSKINCRKLTEFGHFRVIGSILIHKYINTRVNKCIYFIC